MRNLLFLFWSQWGFVYRLIFKTFLLMEARIAVDGKSCFRLLLMIKELYLYRTYLRSFWHYCLNCLSISCPKSYQIQFCSLHPQITNLIAKGFGLEKQISGLQNCDLNGSSFFYSPIFLIYSSSTPHGQKSLTFALV